MVGYYYICRYSRHDKRSKLPGWILSHLRDANLNLSTDMAVHIAREVCLHSCSLNIFVVTCTTLYSPISYMLDAVPQENGAAI